MELNAQEIHDARVALRRIRSWLRTFRSQFEPDWLAGALAHIAWYQSLLGEVRDVDVAIAQLLPLDRTSADSGGLAALTALLATERAEALRRVGASRATPRHAEVTAYLETIATEPPLRRRAKLDAKEALPAILARPWRNLRETARIARRAPTDERLHTVRLRAKELRYASELAAPVLGDDAAALAKVCAKLQGRLGRHNDAVDAVLWLRRAAAAAPEGAFLAGQLAVGQRQIADELAGAWRKEMKKVERAWRTLDRSRRH
jgi:CHAD domain-containing protein